MYDVLRSARCSSIRKWAHFIFGMFLVQPVFVDMKVGTFYFPCMFFIQPVFVDTKVGTLYFPYVFGSAGVRRYEGGHILFYFPCNVFRSAGVRRYEGGHILFSIM